MQKSEAWSAYWSPIFSCLAAQCISPCREIRHNAMTILQKLLLSVDPGSDEQWWLAVFDKVLFPLNLQLLEPAVIRLDLTGIWKSHVHVTTLICKAFLRYMDQFQRQHAEGSDKNENVPKLWFRILDAFEQMAERGQGNVIVSISNWYITVMRY
jgi:brefeldin A-resistance guanine nucleotide exchange factor 1